MARPKGVWANFTFDCITCGAELTVTNGKPDPHDCERPVSLADIRAALGKDRP